ncbi:helix-hairpin-helix domain-containing protein [Butyrivibrio proteoclasticus]|uniref:helix-hairpin-helix domain-containing protein n=1 Tax=Butyrivibrio proteoclasticus TaxID=43305 RepID=UPI0006867649|nr:helix-hairpin-helix domain-containing protein [Butyrivibrio proteoclasticus]
MRYRVIPVFLIMFVLLTGCSLPDQEIEFSDLESSASISSEDFSVESSTISSDNSNVDTNTIDTLQDVCVYVCGAVNAPGVYSLPSDSRVVDAIEAAGGFSQEADTTYLNLAASISDGIKIKVPTVSEALQAEGGVGSDEFISGGDDSNYAEDSSKSGLVNINSAGIEELKTLSGIGDGLAQRIIDYRNDNGRFNSIEDIMKVPGIKDKLFAKIKDYITI